MMFVDNERDDDNNSMMMLIMIILMGGYDNNGQWWLWLFRWSHWIEVLLCRKIIFNSIIIIINNINIINNIIIAIIIIITIIVFVIITIILILILIYAVVAGRVIGTRGVVIQNLQRETKTVRWYIGAVELQTSGTMWLLLWYRWSRHLIQWEIACGSR